MKRLLADFWGLPLKRARRAARSQKWAEAATAYARHLRRHPHDAPSWVQSGHSLKELGRLKEAAEAYHRATRENPADEDAWIHAAHLERRLSGLPAAIMVLKQGIDVIGIAGDALIETMLGMGGRDLLPLDIQTALETRTGTYALARYGAFLAASERPHCLPAGDEVLAVIDARAASEASIAATCASLGDRACHIVHDGSKRIRETLGSTVTCLLLVEAGTRIEHDAVTRLANALDRTGAKVAYGDHDHWTLREDSAGKQVPVRHTPCFQPMSDPFWFAHEDVRPPCMIVTRDTALSRDHWDDIFVAPTALPGPCSHVPLVLASRQAGLTPAPAATATTVRLPETEHPSIQVIIQTRDAPSMLDRCVNSLWRTASRPDLLDVLIVNNRSVLPETAALLARWADQGIARTLPHDEDFNWARANNLAVQMGSAPIILFLNNDVEMETPNWDDALRRYLARTDVGIVGAQLLYPDRLIQHGGVIFGMSSAAGEPGGPVHEGVGKGLGPPPSGPCDRWSRPRLAAAVTGAVLATTRSLFDAVGGFEERLPVAFNDIDFCLRCRAANLLVVQASDIAAVHRESATRGVTSAPAEQAREHAHWSWLRDRWGGALDLDPAYNPHWVRTGPPFDGISMPTQEALDAWIAASARPQPWSIDG
ncbi:MULTISPECIES: glycosyltransferase [unclassified Novosphingobium]|uniref:glycosyltransferase n=1 Tax=unclassified Novosphingobium TaxID=2644732 RepID=UPI00135AF52A|nr:MULTISPECIES: glycosyltransferase [unclassified Novosphingobium]